MWLLTDDSLKVFFLLGISIGWVGGDWSEQVDGDFAILLFFLEGG